MNSWTKRWPTELIDKAVASCVVQNHHCPFQVIPLLREESQKSSSLNVFYTGSTLYGKEVLASALIGTDEPS